MSSRPSGSAICIASEKGKRMVLVFTISCISQLWEKDIKVYGTQKERNDSENGDEIILTMRVGKAADGKMLLAIRELESSFDSHFEAY